jgi:opacity protein-like surface antigen
MNKVLCSLLAGLTMAVATPAANAADLGARYAPPAPVPVYTAPAAEGWYLRGDVGGSVFRSKGKWHESEIDDASGTDIFNDWTSTDWKSSANLGLGAGYQFNSYLRGDITAEYRTKSKVVGNQIIINSANAYFSGHDTGKIDSWLVLANLYTDIGHFNGITPYVGFGIGAAVNRFSDGYQLSGGTANGSYGVYEKGTKTNLAAAVHAGLSYDITSQLSIDAGYRWLWLGKASTGNKTCYNPAEDPAGNTTCNWDGVKTTEKWWINDMMSHDIRIGLRYKFFDDTPARVPVIAKN